MEIKYAPGVTPDVSGVTSDSTRMLLALGSRPRQHVYPGTVPAPVKATRRAKNRAARIARRAHRG